MPVTDAVIATFSQMRKRAQVTQEVFDPVKEGGLGCPQPLPRGPDTQAALGQAESQLRVYCQCWGGGSGWPGGSEGFVTRHCGAEVTGVLLLLCHPRWPQG